MKRKFYYLSSFILIFVFTILLTSCDFIDKAKDFIDNIGNDSTEATREELDLSKGVVYDDFQIHFMTLGNDKAGDSTYIKTGDVDILIDAGSTASSVDTTSAYIDKYCSDKKLEYIIATHGDSDHISGFPKIFDKYKIDTIIDFEYTTKTTKTYQNYVNGRNNLVENGTKHYFASECWNNQNGASRQFKLSDKVTMDIIYNKYYFEASSDENNHSVCTLFTYTDNDTSKYFMFTGDLEKEGEEALAKYYDGKTKETTLPECDFYKAGHHGSKTSSNDCLLDIIKPKMCVVPCCCGTNEYTGILDNQFPTQAFINRISKWTDKVYIPSTFETYEIVTKEAGQSVAGIKDGEEYIKTSGFKDMNGNIVISCSQNSETNNIEIGLWCSNNSTLLKDTFIFKDTVTLNGQTRTFRTLPDNWKTKEE